MTHFVYRMYSADDQMLYVGCSKDVKMRMSRHKSRAWWPEVARTEIEGYASREEGLRAERALIESERPLYNQVNNPAARPRTEGPHVNYKIPDDLHKALKIMAAQEGVTLKELVIRLLQQGTAK